MASRKKIQTSQAAHDDGALSTGSEFEPVAESAPQSQESTAFILTSTSLLEGALFPMRHLPDRSPDAPEMTGNLRIKGQDLRIPVAAFVTVAKESGELYLRLSLGFKDGVHYYGRLFAASRREHPNAPHYWGFIVLLPVEHKDQYAAEEWEAAPTLHIRGYRRRNAVDNQPRIQLLGAPVEVGTDELPL